GVLGLAVATHDGEVVGVAPARRVLGVPVRGQQLHAYILPREVIRGVVGNLPHELEVLRVGDEFPTEVCTHPFGSVLNMNALSCLRHCTLLWLTILLRAKRHPRTSARAGQRRVAAYRDWTRRNPRFDVPLLTSAFPRLPTRYLAQYSGAHR